MSRGGGRLAACVLALLLCAPAGSARGDGAATETAFLAELDRAKAIGESGRGSDGLRLVTKTLEEHKGQDYVRAKRAHLEDLVSRLAFRAECPPPPPQSVVKGNLKRFVSKTGDLEIRYAADKPHDFVKRDGGGLGFPARFRGPFTVTVKGPAYARTTEDSPSIQMGFEEHPKTGKEQAWVVVYGVPPYEEGRNNVWLPMKIVHYDGEEKKTVAETETSPAKRGAPYRLDLKVTRSRITALLDGKVLGSAPKPDSIFGLLLLDVKGWSEIVIDGQVEPSWIQGQIDAIVEKKRVEFDAHFKVRDHLPAWVYEQGPAPKTDSPATGGEEKDEEGVPSAADVPEEHRAALLKAIVHLAKDENQEALAILTAMREKGAPEAVVALLAARAHIGLDEYSEALAEVEKAIAAGHGGHETLLIKGMILMRLGREEEFVAAIEAAAATKDAPRSVFETGVLYLMLAGRLDAARKMSEGAARRGHRSPVLDAIGRVIVKAQNGPEWPKTHEFKSSNYHISSDIDIETCRQAAAVLEEALTTYRVTIRPLKAEKKRLYRVFLFGGRAGFERYHAEVSLLGSKLENVAGVYSPILKQLLIWNLPSRDEMMKTVRHEGFHQYLDRLLPDPPVWLNEGMAVYYEAFEKVGGELRTDKPRRECLQQIAEKPLRSLAEFFAMSPKEFYAGGFHSYSQAWLVVHMLRHGQQKHREAFKALITRLETEPGRDAVRAVFPDESLPALDTALRAHLASITK